MARRLRPPRPPTPWGTTSPTSRRRGSIKQDKQPATLERLKAELAAAEDDLVTGNPEIASVRLFRIVESPRYATVRLRPRLRERGVHAGARADQGGRLQIRRTLPAARARARHQDAVLRPRVPRHGRHRAGDARTGRRSWPCSITSRRTGPRAAAPCPATAAAEHAYLAAKVAYEAGESARAESLFSNIDRQSRFYAAALYFRGLISARRGHLASARNSLCEIVAQVDQDRFTFFIDGRYYAIKDLAYLALGRISHEQERYDDAYYFYFRVPDDSEQLPSALFEASWSMFQAGEYEAAAAFLEEFDRHFSKTPLAPDVLLLQAMIDLKSCEFDRVRVTLDKLVKTYAPLQAQVAALLKDPQKRAAFYRRLLSKRSIGQPRDPIIELLKIDPRFYKFYADIVALDREAGLIPGEIAVWDELTAHEAGNPAGSNATEAVRLVNDVEALRPLAAGDPQMEEQVADLADAARRAARLGNVGGGRFAKEAQDLLAMSAEARRLRAELVTATSTIANRALVDLDKRLRELLRRSRLTHIDAVIGKKKKLEIEIANLRKGRYPAELFATLQLEGLMGDDEEYWPFEGEYWSDEYENFK